jgi:pimeloyl-ACP methyl ester carboxylesterase
MRSIFLLLATATMINTTGAQRTEKFIKLSTNVKLEYAEQGDPAGPVVIFLHGYTDSWHSFESILPFLPNNIHAFALTQRGHGNSSKLLGGYQPRDFASDVAAFIKEKNLGAAIIAGHSMGGVVAQQFALDYPQLTKAIVVLSSDASFKDNPGMPEFAQEIMKLSDPVSYEFANEFQKATCANPIDSSYYKLLVGESLKVPAHVWKAAATGFMNVDYSQALNNLTVPALLIWGDKDAFVSRNDQDILLTNIKNAKLLVYEGTGHALHWEEPARFAADLTSFVDKVTEIK